jgi:hypothetical protein
MKRKVKLLSQHDLKEIEMFRQYLADLHSNMPATEVCSSTRQERRQVTVGRSLSQSCQTRRRAS